MIAGAVFLSAALGVSLFSSPSKSTNITTQRTTTPADLTQAIGTPDTGYGIDYYDAEYVYRDLAEFAKEFRKFGIEVKLESENFCNLFII